MRVSLFSHEFEACTDRLLNKKLSKGDKRLIEQAVRRYNSNGRPTSDQLFNLKSLSREYLHEEFCPVWEHELTAATIKKPKLSKKPASRKITAQPSSRLIDQLSAIRKQVKKLSPWEKGFVESINRSFRKYGVKLSDKQVSCLEGIYKKYGYSILKRSF